MKTLTQQTVPTNVAGSLRYVLYGTDISPWSTIDNTSALGSWTYQNSPVSPDTYYNGIPQYADVYGKAHVLYSKLDLSILMNSSNAGAQVVCVPVVGETEGGETIISKIVDLDNMTYDELASLKGAKYGFLGINTGGPNKWYCKSMIKAKTMFGVKDVIDSKKLACVLPNTGTLQNGKRQGCADGADVNGYNASAYYIRIFSVSTTSGSAINIQMNMTGYIRLSQIKNTGQQEIEPVA